MLMADYAQTLHSACYRFPLRAAFALVRPRAIRLGHEVRGASHGDRLSLGKRGEVKAWLGENFRLVPQLPGKEAAHG